MIASYGPYAASATGGNGFARDFLAGVAALYGYPLYHNRASPPWGLIWPSVMLAGFGFMVVVPVYVFYWRGAQIRARSKFAMGLAVCGEGEGGKGLEG